MQPLVHHTYPVTKQPVTMIPACCLVQDYCAHHWQHMQPLVYPHPVTKQPVTMIPACTGLLWSSLATLTAFGLPSPCHQTACNCDSMMPTPTHPSRIFHVWPNTVPTPHVQTLKGLFSFRPFAFTWGWLVALCGTMEQTRSDRQTDAKRHRFCERCTKRSPRTITALFILIRCKLFLRQLKPLLIWANCFFMNLVQGICRTWKKFGEHSWCLRFWGWTFAS